MLSPPTSPSASASLTSAQPAPCCRHQGGWEALLSSWCHWQADRMKKQREGALHEKHRASCCLADCHPAIPPWCPASGCVQDLSSLSETCCFKQFIFFSWQWSCHSLRGWTFPKGAKGKLAFRKVCTREEKVFLKCVGMEGEPRIVEQKSRLASTL